MSLSGDDLDAVGFLPPDNSDPYSIDDSAAGVTDGSTIDDSGTDLATGGDSAAGEAGSGSSITGSDPSSPSSPSTTNWGTVVSGIVSGAESAATTLGLTNLVQNIEADASSASAGISQIGTSSKYLPYILAAGVLVAAIAIFI